ncbi:hypothetical protein OEA_16985 [Priestia megaterium NCT-2]|nr:hypothetical protein OEA_16985 [Priestia megaterium NCT-2]
MISVQVFAFPPKQQLEAIIYTKLTFTLSIKKSERIRFSIKNQTCSDLPSNNMLLFQPLSNRYDYCKNNSHFFLYTYLRRYMLYYGFKITFVHSS